MTSEDVTLLNCSGQRAGVLYGISAITSISMAAPLGKAAT